jgi:NAD(P)-dependent dehydrogenase (short-subunit alcohol dehydrogenase family)
MDIAGKVALVRGAGSGIGRATRDGAKTGETMIVRNPR